jgi:hypothetical protein
VWRKPCQKYRIHIGSFVAFVVQPIVNIVIVGEFFILIVTTVTNTKTVVIELGQRLSRSMNKVHFRQCGHDRY